MLYRALSLRRFLEVTPLPGKKIPILEKLMRDGLFTDEKEAAAYLMEGKVFSGSQRLRGGMKIAPDEIITVRGRELAYAGKGGLKLDGAIRDFGLSVEGRVCIDAGASTGGFTDSLLRHGAGLVYAVDVGFGQLVGRLRQDKRVVNCEKTNISDEKLRTLDPRPDLGTVDLSYLSLRKGIPYFQAVLHGQGDLICLVKPLFEIDDAEARRTGIIPPEAYAPLLQRLKEDIDLMPGMKCLQVTHSPVTGNSGTREFFMHVRLGKNLAPVDLTEEITRAVIRAEQLETYRKNGGEHENR